MKQRKKTLPLPENEQAVTAYEKTPEELEAFTAYLAARQASHPVPRLKLESNQEGGFDISMDHPDQGVSFCLLEHALGTTSYEFANGIIGQLINVAVKGKNPDPAAVNFCLDIVAGINPRDQLETLLGAQMAAIHLATMTFARRLAHVENITQQDSAERALNKLARTFTAQMETLKRYRTGGEQKVTVHHVTVNEGGQAIVGTVGQSGGRGEG